MGDVFELGLHQAIDSRARRLGLNDGARSDLMTDVQMTLLKSFAAQAEQALRDEDVDPEVARKVLSRIIQGCLPNPADAQMRMDMQARHIEDLRRPPLVARDGDIPAWQTDEPVV